MKKVYLVLEINEHGNVIGRIFAYSSMKQAEKQKDYLNMIFETCSYIVESVGIS